MMKRILSLLLALLMVVSAIPVQTFAEGEETENLDACPVCGEFNCGLQHISCEVCGDYDCGVDHNAAAVVNDACPVCGELECGLQHISCEVCSNEPCTCGSAEPITELACLTCGQYECESEHLTWCDACKVDDCGEDHLMVVAEGDEEPSPCATCGSTDCTSDHTNWCADCKKDNCGETHVFCETCQKNDCGVNHSATTPTEAPADAIAVIDDGDSSDSAYRVNIGQKATINPMYVGSLYISADPSQEAGWSSVQPTSDSLFTTELTLVIADVYDNGTELWYKVSAAEGHTLPDTLTAKPWVFQNVIGDSSDVDSLILMEDEPENPCGCCEDCINAEGCECGCEECAFCEMEEPTDPEEPEVPSISHPETGIVVYAESFPQGVTLEVARTDVSSQLNAFRIPASKQVFGLDITLRNADNSEYQPDGALVKLPVSAPVGTKIGILHTHGDDTTFMGVTEVLPDNTVEFYTDGFSEFAGFTVDFHYNGVSFSIEGMTSILLSELFTALDIDEDATQATSVVFTDNALVGVSQDGEDWRLTSLQAFKTEETLIITFTDGRTIIIDVTDAVNRGDYDYVSGTPYTIPTEDDDYIVIWIDRDQLPATVKLQGHYTYSWSVDTADPNQSYASFKADGKTAEIYVDGNAPVGYKYSLRNRQFIGNRCRGIVRVIESVKFRYNKGNIVTSTTTWPSNSGTKKIGNWSMADTTANTEGRTNTFTISSTTPKATGYTFVNWSYKDWQNMTKTASPGATVRLDESSINEIDRNYVDFTANWTPIEYKITYDENGGSAVSDQTYTVETNLTLRAAPQRSGYNFTGWQLSSAAGSWTAGTYSASQNKGQKNYGNITLVAQWDLDSYTATYDANGGVVTPASHSFKLNNEIPLPQPTREGYNFNGWTITAAAGNWTNGTAYDKTTTSIPAGMYGNVTFTAQWTPISYSVSFNGNGSTSGSMSNQSFTFGTAQNLTANAYTRAHTVTFNNNGAISTATATATFNGWEDQGTIVYQGTTYGYPDFDVPYYANSSKSDSWPNGDIWGNFGYNKYRIMQHYVEHGLGEGRPTKDPTGKVWVYPNGAEVNNMSSTNGAIVSLYANWTLGSVTLPTPGNRAGYTFQGWSDGTTTYAAGATYTPKADVTLTAQWTAKNYTITYNTAGGTLGTGGTTSYKITDSITIPSASYAGHEFEGWKVTAVETEGNWTNGASVSAGTIAAAKYGNVTLTAQWSEIITTAEYTVRIHRQNVALNGYDTTEVTPKPSGDVGATVTVDSVDYDAVGFTYNSSDSTASGTILADGSLTLNLYYDRNTHTVTYAAGAGNDTVTGMPTGGTYAYGADVTISMAEPSRTGYEFNGWSHSPSVTVENGKFTMPNHAVTFTGSWTPITYTISYNLNGGSVTPPNPTSYTVESDPITLKNPTKTGYTFAGWTGTGLDAATMDVTIPTGSTGDRSYTANWTQNSYTVTWKNWDGATLKTEQVDYGKVPTYNGTPTRPSTSQYEYTFAGWDTTPVAVTEDATYTATYTETVRKYTVTFVDEDGTTILKEATEYEYGTAAEDIVRPDDPTKEETAGYAYTFSGWAPELVAVTEDATYQATYEKAYSKINYVLNAPSPYYYETAATLSRESEKVAIGGTPLGSTVTENEENFEFHGWYSDEACTQLITKELNFTPTDAAPTTYYAKVARRVAKIHYVIDGFPEKYLDEWDRTGYEEVKMGGHCCPSGGSFFPGKVDLINMPWEYLGWHDAEGNYVGKEGGDEWGEDEEGNPIYVPSFSFDPIDHCPEEGWPENIYFYVKYVEREAIIKYVPVGPDGSGSVSVDEETVPAVTGTPSSVAVPSSGYSFVGWYSDPECTQLVTNSATITPAKNRSMEFLNFDTEQWEVVQYYDFQTPTTYYAKFEKVDFTISYDLDGGTVSPENPTSYGVDSQEIVLNNPTKPGYDFVGWTGTGLDAMTKNVTIPTGSTGDREYTAHWEEAAVTIRYEIKTRFSPNEGEKTASLTVESENVLAINGVPSGSTIQDFGDNFEFVGWYDNAELNGDPISTEMHFVPEKPADGIWKSTTYYAKINRKIAHIYYEIDGIDMPEGKKYDIIDLEHETQFQGGFGCLQGSNVRIKEYDFVSLPWEFLGWYDAAGNLVYDEQVEIAPGVTIPHFNVTPDCTRPGGWPAESYYYARFQEREVEFNYVPVGPVGATDFASLSATQQTVSVFADNVSSTASAANSGYKFVGWYADPECTELITTDATYKPEKNAKTTMVISGTNELHELEHYDFKSSPYTYYAKFELKEYTITFDTDGGSEIDPITQDYGTVVIAPADPTKEGYTFAGWDPEIPTTMPAENVTVKALWTPTEYTISYTMNGGSVTPANPTSYTVESAPITLNNPTRTGYTFAGWTGTGLNAATKDVTISTGSTGDRSYTATWTPITYTITYDYADGTTDNKTVNYDIEDDLTLESAPSREGYKFTGWKLETVNYTNWTAGDYEASKNVGTGKYGNVTFKAQWEEQYRYELKFDANGGSNPPATMTQEWCDDASKAFTWTTVPTRNGYTFKGWAEAADSTENVAGEGKNTYTLTGIPAQTAEETLYAIWERQTGSLLLDYNGDGTPVIVTITGKNMINDSEEITITVVITGDTTITDLPTGTYTATAESARATYTASAAPGSANVESGKTADVDVTVSTKGTNWFTGFSRVINTFKR